MFHTRCKCFKHVHVQNTFIIFKTRCYSVSDTLLIFKKTYILLKRVANVSNALIMFQTRFKCF